MPVLAAVAAHLGVEELFERYRQCPDGRLKSHWHVLWLRSTGETTHQVGKVVGFRDDWVRRIVRRYNAGGPTAIRDHVKDNGREGYLSAAQKKELVAALAAPPPEGGLWNSRKVAAWIAEKTGKERVCTQTGWEYLRSLGFTIQRPRPRHPQAPKDALTQLKKRSARGWRRLGASNPAGASSFGRRMKPA